ncbi:MAG: hypothetical protein KGI38_10680 [Thaumarchaeota archaeon]|nr:hypothetical protein [Nitrososphaerota archaeon]
MGTKKRVVQTELDESDYETLVQIAKSKNLSIKDAAREAMRWWSASLSDLEQDPLFKLKPVEFKAKVRSEQMEGFLYRR